jgi:hypothetical protein
MTTIDDRIAPRPVRAGEQVVRNSATHAEGKVYLGDAAPVFQPRPVRAGEPVVRDAATHANGKVYLGDAAKVYIGDAAPVFTK